LPGPPSGDTLDVFRKPAGLKLGPRSSGGKSGGPNPVVVVAAAALAGVLVAKLIDWRGHAHPRR
jgi:hypothetical protein